MSKTQKVFACFLAHLSTKCSGWAIVIGLCPLSSIVRRASSVVRKLFYLNTFSSETAHWILTKLHSGLCEQPGWSPIKVVQTVRVGCISRSQGQKIGFQNVICKNLLVQNYKAQSFHIWYIASSRGPLPKLFKLCPWGQIWPCPGGHNFTLIYIRKTYNDIFSWTANGNLTKLHWNDPWLVPYQSSWNRSS